MSKFIKNHILQPGNYTISKKGFIRICTAGEESGFDGNSEVYAKNPDTDEILFKDEEESCFTLKNNETGEEEILTVVHDSSEGILYSERDESETDTDESDESDDDEDDELCWRYDIQPDQIIARDDTDDLYIDTDQYYFEERCPEGIVEKTFEVKEPLDLSKTSFHIYEDDANGRTLFLIDLPSIGKINKIKEKGDGTKHGFSINYCWGSYTLSEIREYLGGPDSSDPGVAYTDIYDGFVIKDGVLTAYKGYSDKIVIPETVTEIADNVFLFPLESIKMPNKEIKVGKNFPWDKVL